MHPGSPHPVVSGDHAPGRRAFLRLGAGALAWSAVGGLSGCRPGPPLRVALGPWAGYQFIFLAEEAGWLPNAGLHFITTTVQADSVKALAEGRVDAAGLTLDEVLMLRDRGIDVAVAMVFDISAGADAVLARPGIKSLAALKGKRIAREDTSLGSIVLNKALKAAGLSPDALDIVAIGSDHVEAWKNDKLDAIVTYEPALSQLEALGLERLYDSRSLPQMIVDVLAIRPAAAERHADALRGLIAGHFRALELWRHNPIDTAYRLSARLGLKPAEVDQLFKGLNLPDVLYNREYLSPPAAELSRAALEIADIMARERMLAHPPATRGMFLPDYLPVDSE